MRKFLLENQVHFLNVIKSKVAQKKSKVEALASILSIDTNTMYKRLEGKTPLTLEEACILSQKFSVPLETLFEAEDAHDFPYKVFHHGGYIRSMDDFKIYIQNMRQNLQFVSEHPDSQLFYSAKDIPIFYFFAHPLLASFKIWYWLRYVCNIPELKNQPFTPDIVPAEILENAEYAYHYFKKVNVTEIWNENSSYAVLAQIFEAAESRLVPTSLALEILDIFLLQMERLKFEAADGLRTEHRSRFDLYFNRTLIMDNSSLILVAGQKFHYVPHTGIHYLRTNDKEMTWEYENWYLNQMQKSELVSRGNEKLREYLFITIREGVEKIKKKISLLD